MFWWLLGLYLLAWVFEASIRKSRPAFSLKELKWLGIFFILGIVVLLIAAWIGAITHPTAPNDNGQQESPAPLLSPSPTPPLEATPPPQFVWITQSVSVGNNLFPAGTPLEFLYKGGSDVYVRYQGGVYAIPISATDLK